MIKGIPMHTKATMTIPIMEFFEKAVAIRTIFVIGISISVCSMFVTIRITMQKQCFLRASTTLHCFCTVSLNSYGLYNNITRLPIEKQEKNGILKEILRGRGKTCQITFLLHYPNIVRRISCRCICRGTKEIRCV